jgi:hypothetical protein
MGAQKQAKAVSSLAVSLKSAGDALLQMAHKADELGELLGQQVAEEEAQRAKSKKRSIEVIISNLIAIYRARPPHVLRRKYTFLRAYVLGRVRRKRTRRRPRRGATGRRRRRMTPIPIPTPAPTRIDHVQRYGVWTQGTRGAKRQGSEHLCEQPTLKKNFHKSSGPSHLTRGRTGKTVNTHDLPPAHSRSRHQES